ncbi:alpha/beta hydrolase [Psychroserpens algicola]|uniref:alpha/beta hydrolase n=1 Tax=Psychroserpens algicola TaxID=1719034 RepID=UPI001953014F|nr:alpha/beta hydrolase [Psychroserpens algicola]
MILQYKDIPVFYEDEGKGKAIILLHGFLENSTMWTDIKSMLVVNHRVICIDLLGHGKTGCLGYMHSMRMMADTVLAVLSHLKIQSYSVIGHSMGGYVALELAEKQPKQILGLCLMNSTYEADDDERKTLRKRANKIAKTSYENLVRLSFTNLFSDDSRVLYKKALEDALAQALKTPLQGYLAAQEGMMSRKNKLEFFKTWNAKKLIIIGKKDPVVNGERILNETKETSIVCEQLSLGHMSYIENKKELSYLIKHFVE